QLVRIFTAICTFFAAWAALSSLWNVVAGPVDQPDVVLAGGAVWINWSVTAMLAAVLVSRNRDGFESLLLTLALAAAFIAATILLQLLIEDYSYVLATAGIDDLFVRVRGTYYYHAPPVQYLAVMFPIIAALMAG